MAHQPFHLPEKQALFSIDTSPDAPPEGDRWSSWDGATHGPEAAPGLGRSPSSAPSRATSACSRPARRPTSTCCGAGCRAPTGSARWPPSATATATTGSSTATPATSRAVACARAARCGRWPGAPTSASRSSPGSGPQPSSTRSARLWELGLPVPYPVQLDESEMLMSFVGDTPGDTPVAAPRLVSTRPEPALLAELFEQLRSAMLTLAHHGWAHGDLSPYNVLRPRGAARPHRLAADRRRHRQPPGLRLPRARRHDDGHLVRAQGARRRPRRARRRPRGGGDQPVLRRADALRCVVCRPHPSRSPPPPCPTRWRHRRSAGACSARAASPTSSRMPCTRAPARGSSPSAPARSSGRRTSPRGTASSGPTGRTPTSWPTPTWMPCTSPARTASTTSTPCSRCAPGKPVLVEKAFTRSLREADEVLATAEAPGLLAAEAMWSRYLPHYDVIRRTVEAGTLGEVVLVDADHGQLLWPRRPGPALAARAGRRGAARPRRLPGLVRRPRARRPRGRHGPRHADRPRGRRHHDDRGPRARRRHRPPVVLDGGGHLLPGPGGRAPGPGSRWRAASTTSRAGCG